MIYLDNNFETIQFSVPKAIAHGAKGIFFTLEAIFDWLYL